MVLFLILCAFVLFYLEVFLCAFSCLCFCVFMLGVKACTQKSQTDCTKRKNTDKAQEATKFCVPTAGETPPQVSV